MKTYSFLFSFFLFPLFLLAQMEEELPEFSLKKETAEAHLRYIASDEMQGRRTGSKGAEITADYLARLFEIYGLKTAEGADGYFQNIPLDVIQPPASANLKLAETAFTHGDNLLVFSGKEEVLKAEAVFAGHGWVDQEKGHNDYADLGVKGKIVFVLPGIPDSRDPMVMFNAMPRKAKFAIENGAVGVVELFRLNFPWRFFKSYFNKERMEVAHDADGSEGFFYAFIKEGKNNPVAQLEEGSFLPISIENSGVKSQRIYAPNVVGILEGSDEKLKEEYLLVCAHYDHVGVGKEGGGAYTPQDSIFNGARDNGMGTVALLSAIKSLTQKPPKRSVIFLACTGEEMGMIGSAYYADNPLVPLEKTVFNLNNDGGGYNTIEQFSIIGYEHTNVAAELEKAASVTGLSISIDPAKEMGLYERSDNISFAKKGIPAIDFAPGVTAMDEEIMKYYHQVTDNPESIDYDYLLKFCKAFAHAARLIADKEEALDWMPDSKYAK